jgi:hypothetical protein
VLVDGALACFWRPAKKGRRLVVTVEPLGLGGQGVGGAPGGRVERLAPLRGATAAELAWAP